MKYRLISFLICVFFLNNYYYLLNAQDTEIPPGQKIVEDFPILHIADIPDLDRENWKLKVTGDVEKKLTLGWEDFAAFQTVEIISDFHCVTGWSRLKNRWTGVLIRDILEKVRPKKKAGFITFRSADGYYTSLPICLCTGDQDILAFRWEGEDLGREKGGPVRVVIPSRYGYKSAMWVIEMKVTERQEKGYWEKAGYSNSADPWQEERFEGKNGKPDKE